MAPAGTEAFLRFYIIQKGACLSKRMERHYKKKSHERKSEAMGKLPDRV